MGSLTAPWCYTGVCGCWRFGRSGAFNPGTGDRWCWENKLLSPQPCWSIPGVSLPLCLRPSSLFPPSFFFPVVSRSFVFACASCLLCFDSVVGPSEISSPPRSSCVFVQTGKEDDISRIASRLMQYYRESNGKKPTEKRTKKMM